MYFPERSRIARCKVGDFVITLGPDSAAPESRIVFEAKEDRSYSQKDALIELQKARENREAQVGVFVFSRESAPEGLDSLTRWDKDLIVVWDAHDPNTDVVLKTCISVARMIAVQSKKASERTATDIAEMKALTDALCRDVSVLDEIVKSAAAAQNHCDKIATKAGGLKKRIDTSLTELQGHIASLDSNGE